MFLFVARQGILITMVRFLPCYFPCWNRILDRPNKPKQFKCAQAWSMYHGHRQCTTIRSYNLSISFLSKQVKRMARIIFNLHFLYILYYACCIWSSCRPIPTTPGLPGQYFCTDNHALILSFVLEHECTLTCGHKSTCAAIISNTSDNTCSLLPATCHFARSDPVIVYTIFNVDRDNCIEWQDYNYGMAEEKRWVGTEIDNESRFLARLTLYGDTYPGYLVHQPNKHCFTAFGGQEHHTQTTCQVLRVRECTLLAFVPYTACNIIPHDAVAIEGTAGTMRYIAVTEDPDPVKSRATVVGYYIAGGAKAEYQYHGVRYTSQMQLVIVL